MTSPALAMRRPLSRRSVPSLRSIVTAVVALWFAGVLAAHYAGLLRAPPGGLPVPFGVAIAVPIAVFFALYRTVPRFREAVLGVDAAFVTSLQAWRVAGFVFLPLLPFGHLPGLFAWPAGLGDVAVGLTAPLVARRVVRDSSYVSSGAFAAFHWLGLLDVASALTTFTLASGVIAGLTDPTTVAIEEMPLSLVPGFLVPAFVILHAVALLKTRARPQAR